MDSGCQWGFVQPEWLPGLWKRAAQHGKRRLVLELVAQADHQDLWDGRIEVNVLADQTWEEHQQSLSHNPVQA